MKSERVLGTKIIMKPRARRSKTQGRFRTLVAVVFVFAGLGFTPALAAPARAIDVVAVTWTGARAAPGNVDQVASVINNEVGPRWKALTTLYGDTKDRSTSFVSGQVLTSAINLRSPMPCTGAQSNSFISQVRAEAYKRFNISDYSVRYLVIVSPAAGCIWSGRALVGSPENSGSVLALHNTISAFVIAHELGHSLGLGHSNFMRCSSGISDGPWGTDCKAVEYGGAVDLMGNIDTTSPLSTYHQWRMGLLDSADIKQSWVNETINLAPSDYATGTRVIFLRDGKSTYWVEYRRSTNGVTYSPGLVVYRTDPPPISSIVSPNPEDALQGEFGTGIAADFWMLNLGNYKYLGSTVAGSMTLPSATPVTFYSGNLSLSAIPSGEGVAVTIKRKSVTTALATPVLTNLSTWKYPGVEIVKPDLTGADIAITHYQIQVNGTISDLPPATTDNWLPTYLNPFSAPKTVHLRDLPEGSYSLAIRAVDVNGNKSPWSTSVNTIVDRSRPVVTSNFSVTSIDANKLILSWTGARDAGSGLCQTNLINEDGLILQSSTEKSAPKINLVNGVTLKAKAQLFDCIGNGVIGDLSVSNSVTDAGKSSRIGKWVSVTGYGLGALKCTGKCSASFLTKGRFVVLMGDGSAQVISGSKVVAQIANSNSGALRIGASVDLGASKKIVRISGSNFVLIGLGLVNATFTNVKDLDRLPAISDPSFSDSKQVVLSKYGFNAGDFSQEWTVLPMGGGTTLGDATLDLCSGVYSSEKERLERRQVIATKVASPFSFLSTEVVRYSSAAAAEAALGELKATLAICQNDKGYKDLTGTFIPQTFSSFPALSSGLVPDASRLLVRSQINTGASARQLLALYQYSGDIFTGLYIIVNSDKALTDAQVKNWLQIGVIMANRLSGKSI